MGLGLGILSRIQKCVYPYYNANLKFPLLYKKQFKLAKVIRERDNIKVLFVLTSLASWKTEELYIEMSLSNCFSTYILITTAGDEDSRPTLRNYLKLKGYDYFELEKGEKIYSKLVPDIIFYEKPYEEDLADRRLRYDNYNKSVFCYIDYAFHNASTPSDFLFDNALQNIAFQEYIENVDVSEEIKQYKTNRGINNVVTGFPISDVYIKFNKEKEYDPWKRQNCIKKRIIYAPHHTIDHAHEWLPYSTFLEFGNFMLEMAEKYKEKVQFAFKPHPVLKRKLERLWGREKTDEYYNKWGELDNCQLEAGTYMNLFMFSDAMIHDCGSFQIEYHYTHKPVMYLTHNEEDHRNGLFHFAQQAFDLHYKGHNKEEIEQFIQNVIKDEDPMKEQRMEFYKKYLLPPNGLSATQNIIDAILGQRNYK